MLLPRCFWTEEPVQKGLCMNLQTSYWKNFAFNFQKTRTVLTKFVVCWFLYFPYLAVKKKGFSPLKLKDFGLNGLDTMFFVLLQDQKKLVEQPDQVLMTPFIVLHALVFVPHETQF